MPILSFLSNLDMGGGQASTTTKKDPNGDLTWARRRRSDDGEVALFAVSLLKVISETPYG